MLKRLAVFALLLLIHPVRTYAQTNKARQTSKGDQPSPAAASVVPQQTNSPTLKAEADKNVRADVRVVSTPDKDSYDKAAFWVNLVLASVGILGVIAAIGTLCVLRIQTKAALVAAKAALLQANHIAASERPWLAVNISQPTFDEVMNPQSHPENGFLHVVVRVKNYGKTPAFVAESWIDSFSERTLDAKAVPLVPDLPSNLNLMGRNKPAAAQIRDSVYVPDQGFTLHCAIPKQVLVENNTEWRAGTKCLCIVGLVQYRDAFSQKHITRFCYAFQAISGVPLIAAETRLPLVPAEFAKAGPDIYNEMT